MEKMKAGFIGYMPKDADVYATAEAYAKIGYSLMEGAGVCFRGGDPAENAKRLRGYGLDLYAIGQDLRKPEDYPDIAEIVKKCRLVGVDRVITYCSLATDWRFGGRDALPTYDETMAQIDLFEKFSAELRKEGIQYLFHNHDTEFFVQYKGVRLIDWLLTQAPDMQFEVDLGWVTYAGEDCPKVVKRMASRIDALHVKDFARGEIINKKPDRDIVMPRFTTPGTGFVDLEACFQPAAEAGIRWAIIEQDQQYHLSQLDSVRTAYYNMLETGYVE